jgi:predicted membrane-bound mannosyltransferase
LKYLANPPPKIRWAIFIAIALMALAVRLPQLGERPMHTDESVNAFITGDLLAGEPFRYDSQDRHGPALFLVAEPLAKLLGARNFSGLTETQLRFSTVLTGTATVLLFGAGVELFGFMACFVAALLFAVAPLPVYYSRYFIHETLFVAATLGLVFSGWRAGTKHWALPRLSVASARREPDR